jgi:hypothetical protein
MTRCTMRVGVEELPVIHDYLGFDTGPFQVRIRYLPTATGIRNMVRGTSMVGMEELPVIHDYPGFNTGPFRVRIRYRPTATGIRNVTI